MKPKIKIDIEMPWDNLFDCSMYFRKRVTTKRYNAILNPIRSFAPRG